jgi:hypothetical protein
VDRAELKRLASQPDLLGPRIITRLPRTALTELDRLRMRDGYTRADALNDAAGLWIAREIRREARRERIRLIREMRPQREEITRAMDRKIAALQEGLGLGY